MKYDPFIEQPLHTVYDDIAIRPIFKNEDNMLRVAILFIDPESILYKEKDFELRLRKSLSMLNIPEDSKALIAAAINGNSKEWQEVMYEYFRLVHNTTYEAWWSLLQSFHQLNKSLRSNNVKVRERLLVFKEIKAIKEQLLNLEYDLFQDEHIKRAIAKSALDSSLQGYAEKYALPSP